MRTIIELPKRKFLEIRFTEDGVGVPGNILDTALILLDVKRVTADRGREYIAVIDSETATVKIYDCKKNIQPFAVTSEGTLWVNFPVAEVELLTQRNFGDKIDSLFFWRGAEVARKASDRLTRMVRES